MNTDKLKTIALAALAALCLAGNVHAQSDSGSTEAASAPAATAEQTSGDLNPGTDRLFDWRTFIWESRNPDKEFWPANGERGRVAFEFQRMFINTGDWHRFVGGESPQFWTLRFSVQLIRMFLVDATLSDRYELARELHDRIDLSMGIDYHYVMVRFRPDLLPVVKPYVGFGWSFWKGHVRLKDEFNHTSESAATVGKRYCLGADFLIESNSRSINQIGPSLFVEWVYDKATLDYRNFGDFTVTNHGWAAGLGMVIY